MTAWAEFVVLENGVQLSEMAHVEANQSSSSQNRLTRRNLRSNDWESIGDSKFVLPEPELETNSKESEPVDQHHRTLRVAHKS